MHPKLLVSDLGQVKTVAFKRTAARTQGIDSDVPAVAAGIDSRIAGQGNIKRPAPFAGVASRRAVDCAPIGSGKGTARALENQRFGSHVLSVQIQRTTVDS